MASEFVEPYPVRIHLSGENRWIDVRKELTAGEHDKMMASIIKDTSVDGKPVPDFEKTASYRIIAYLLGWSFTDSNGQHVPVSASAIANLKVSTRDEIARVVNEHDAKSDAEIATRKNAPAPASSAT